MVQKAYIAKFRDEDWCFLVHGETPGKARARANRVTPGDSDRSTFVDIGLTRLPGCDDRPLTAENAFEAGFRYGFDSDDSGDVGDPQYWNIDCDCPICRAGK